METGKKQGKWIRVGKLAAISATVLIVSLGLCGLSVYTHPNDYVTVWGLLTVPGILAGAGGLLVAIIMAIIACFAKEE